MSYYSLRTQETSGRLKTTDSPTADPTHNRKDQAEEHPLPKPGLETVGAWRGHGVGSREGSLPCQEGRGPCCGACTALYDYSLLSAGLPTLPAICWQAAGQVAWA